MKTLADTVMEKTARLICNLRARWNDEREFEDWADYEASMKKALEGVKDVEFTAATKRPFGFKWKGSDGFKRHTFIKGRGVLTMRSAT